MTPFRARNKRIDREPATSRCRATRTARFEVFGPFDLPIAAPGTLDRSRPALARFWNDVEGREGGLSVARGCFVLTERTASSELRPWFVGAARTAPYRDTLTAPRLRQIAESVLALNHHSILSLSLICRLSSNGRFADVQQIDGREFDVLEAYLSALCLARNPQADWQRSGSRLADLIVPGLLNAGRLPMTIDARVLRSALGL